MNFEGFVEAFLQITPPPPILITKTYANWPYNRNYGAAFFSFDFDFKKKVLGGLREADRPTMSDPLTSFQDNEPPTGCGLALPGPLGLEHGSGFNRCRQADR
jgi:hypothetical protein